MVKQRVNVRYLNVVRHDLKRIFDVDVDLRDEEVEYR